jgi:hypothetical protein
MTTIAAIIKIGPAFRAPRRAPEWVRKANHATLDVVKMCGGVWIADGSVEADALRAANQIAEGR